jgi:uncharacterized RDD family membrane protein YckC
VILYTIPSKSARLLARRAISFVVDLAILALFTYAVLDLLYRVEALTPNAVLSMAIVWTWFFYFVLFDWRLEGTPGMLIVGLRLKNAGTGISGFVKCLLRILVTLIVPITIAGRITALVTSKATSFIIWCAALALLAFQPLSIALFGGQSAPDLLLGTGVFPKNASSREYAASLNRNKWLLLVSTSLVAGILLEFAGIPGLGGRFKDIASSNLPGMRTRNSGEAEARVQAALRMSVLKDMPEARDIILEDFKVYSATGALPSATKDQTPDDIACSDSFKLKKRYSIVYAKSSLLTPTFIDALLFKDMVALTGSYTDRPGYLVFEVVKREPFGIFDLERSEDYIFCVTSTNQNELGKMVGLSGVFSPVYSLQFPALLVLGDLERYTAIEKIPIWPPS